MTTPTHINSLPHDVLVRIFSSSTRPISARFETDAWTNSSWPTPEYLLENSDFNKFLSQKISIPLSVPPPSADAAHNLLIASVCSLWRDLVMRRVSTLLVKKDCVVSRQDLANAVSRFPHLTHLHLSDRSVEALDDAVLAHLASSCLDLTAFHIGDCVFQGNGRPKRANELLVTKAGLDNFFHRCSRLEHLSLCNSKLHDLPDSLFLLAHLQTLRLDDASILQAPGITTLTSLTDLSIDARKLSSQQLSTVFRLSSLTRLTSLSVSSAIILVSADLPIFAFTQLPYLKSLKLGLQFTHYSRIFPTDLACSRLECWQLSYCNELERLPANISDLLPCIKKLSICCCRNFTQLSEGFTRLTGLESFTLSTCNVRSLPGDFGKLPNLRSVVLQDLPLDSLPASFCMLKSLETLLVIECKGLHELPAGFGRLTALKSLYLKHLPHLELPGDIGSLVNLQTLYLQDNDQQQLLPSSFTQLTSLTRLDLDQCIITEIPEAVGELRNLRMMSILGCHGFSQLPDSVTALTMLETLRMIRCYGVCSVPSSLQSLTKLTELDLRQCNVLEAVPEPLSRSLVTLGFGNFNCVTPVPDFSSLLALKKLSLIQVTVSDGMAAASSLSGLRHLELYLADEATEFPFQLALLSNLCILSISKAGSMQKLPAASLVSTLQQLQQLEICTAEVLTELPATISSLQNLTSILVHAGNLSSLPDGIGALTRLRKLDLSKCSSLTHLPASLTQLSCLHDLNLAFTAIRLLPQDFSQMSRLKSLCLQDCRLLEALPKDLSELKMLDVLNTAGCDKLPEPSRTNILA